MHKHKLKLLRVVLLVVLLLCFLALIFLVFRDSRRSEDEKPKSLDTTDTRGDTESLDDTLYIYCIDVGQGDATLIVSPTDETMLIDAGKNGRGNSEVVLFLNGLGITSVDYIVATHYHADHIGGIDEVVNSLSIDSIGAVYDRGGSYTSQTYSDYVAAVASKRDSIELGQVISLGANVSLVCVAANAQIHEPELPLGSAFKENDLSVALKLTYEEFDFFVGGDLSGADSGGYTDVETPVAPTVGEVEVYQVNHHGSKYSSNPFFLETLRPQVSIISVGNNSYGHPNPDVIARLEALPSAICQTEDGDGNIVHGDIIVKARADEFWVEGTRYDCWGTVVRP